MNSKKVSALCLGFLAMALLIYIVSEISDQNRTYAHDFNILYRFNIVKQEIKNEVYSDLNIGEKSKINLNAVEIKELNAITQLENKYIKILRSEDAKNVKMVLEDLYMENSIKVEVSGLKSKSINQNSIISVMNNKDLNRDEDMSLNYTRNVDITYVDDINNRGYTAIINIEFDNIYAYDIYEDENCFYLKLSNPRKVYDKILVIDAGHGGMDGGTSSLETGCYEKEMNLSIVLYLKELLDKENIKVYYTRLDDKRLSLEARVSLANNLNADFFISIHCNASEESQPNGTEVLYDELSDVKGVNSKELSKICLEEVVDIMNTRDRGLVKSNDIYIVGHSKVPVALIEVGYMTNKGDLDLIRNESNRKLFALGIYNCVIRAYNQLDKSSKLE